MVNFFTKRIALISFFIMIAVQMLCYNYIDYLRMEPRSIHSWRQSDCLSFVINFYNGRTTFFEPGVSNLGPTGDGKVASDFPIIQYGVAQLWKITGPHTLVYRLVDLMFLVVALLYIYKLYCYWFNGRYGLALFATGLMFTSTLLAYYGPTVLSDIQALGLSCAGFYYFILWLDAKDKRHFICYILAFTAAGLLKMSSAFIFSITLAYWIIRLMCGHEESKKGLFSFQAVLGLIFPFIPWLLWYGYGNYYNTIHPNNYFLIGIAPLWIVQDIHVPEVLSSFKKDVLPIAFNPWMLSFIGFGLLSIFILNIKSFFTETYLQLLAPVAIVFCYLILFFQVFGEHDYYLINMMPALAIVIGLMIRQALVLFPSFFNSTGIQIAGICLLFFLTHETAVFARARIEMKGWGFDAAVLTKERRDYFEWNTWDDRRRYATLEGIEEETLTGFGLGKDKKVLCLGDYTINRSLYLLNRIGYTSFNQDLSKIDEFIVQHRGKDIHYLIITDWQHLEKEKLAPFLIHKVFEKEGVSIYKL